MDIQGTKLELIQYLLNTQKESLLLKVKELISNDRQETVGHTGSGESISLEKLYAKLEKAEKDYQLGKVTTDEDLEKEIENFIQNH